MVVQSVPEVAESERVSVEVVDEGFYRVIARFGFMEIPSVPPVLERAAARLPLRNSLAEATYFVGRENFLSTSQGRMSALEEEFFAFLSRNSTDITKIFELPSEQVMEMGTRVDL